MPGLATSNFRRHNAEQFVEAFSEAANTSMYLYIGGTIPYADGSDVTSNYATPLNDIANVEYIPWRDTIAAKKIQSSDITNGIRRNNWTTGTVYEMYDHTDVDMSVSTKKFHVITEDYNIYKCLSNNYGSASTVKPTGTGTTEISLADGYIWKYMYTVTTSDALKFVTNDYIPVKTDSTVAAAAIDGAIHYVKRLTTGSGYYQGNTTLIIVGDGTGATASPIISSGGLASISISSKGTGYTYATAVITSPTGVGATAIPIISPKNGHGKDAVKELYGTYVMINARLSGSESSTIPTQNDYRKLGLIRDPFLYGTTSVAYGSNYRVTYRYAFSSTPTQNYQIDETVSATVDTVTTTAIVVDWDATNKYLYTTKPVPKDITSSVVVTGLTSNAVGTVTSVDNPGLAPYTGDVLYIENRGRITRTADQIEDIKLIIQF
jgi:hypothetical protein